jgi:hypothetical protein
MFTAYTNECLVAEILAQAIFRISGIPFSPACDYLLVMCRDTVDRESFFAIQHVVVGYKASKNEKCPATLAALEMTEAIFDAATSTPLWSSSIGDITTSR